MVVVGLVAWAAFWIVLMYCVYEYGGRWLDRWWND